MARVLLIDPLGWQDGVFNLGLACLSASLKTAGHEAHVIDLNNKSRTPEQVVEIVRERDPQYVGFSVKSATFASAVELHRKLAAVLPEITYIYGGPHVTLSGTSVLDETPRAFLIRGDAEFSLADFISRHERGESNFSDIPGIVYRDFQSRVHAVPVRFHRNIDDLPLPDFTDFDTFDSFKTYPLLTSRGCPYKCSYCSVPAISGSRWVYRSTESVMRELDYVINVLKLKSVVIVDDNFTLNKRRAASICRAIIDRNYDLLWSCGNGIRADRIWPDLAELIYRAGCREAAVGIESFDGEVFARLGKGEELGHIRRGVQTLQAVGIKVTGFFMIGLPGSTYRKDLKTLAMAQRLGLSNYYFGLTVPYPGTELWDWAQKNARFLIPWQNSYHISEVFRDGLERLNLAPVFDTPEYPAEQRQRVFRMAQEAKSRSACRSLRIVQNSLRSAPGRPVVVLRSSRCDGLFVFFKDISPSNPHVIVFKGREDFLKCLTPEVLDGYDIVRIPGEGFFDSSDVSDDLKERLENGVVAFDVPGGSLDKYGNVLDFARAFRPRQVVALLGDEFQLLPTESSVHNTPLSMGQVQKVSAFSHDGV